MVLKRPYSIFIKRRREDYRRRLLHQFQHFKAIDLWHLYVKEDEVGMVLLNRLDAFEAIAAFLDDGDLRIGPKVFPNDHPGQGLVVNDNSFDGSGWYISVCHMIVAVFSQ